MKFTAQWRSTNDDFPLARTLISKNKDQTIRQMQNQPARCLSKHTYIEVREAAEEEEPKCNHNSLVKLQNYEYFCFDGQYHLTIPFEDSAQKVRFFRDCVCPCPDLCCYMIHHLKNCFPVANSRCNLKGVKYQIYTGL